MLLLGALAPAVGRGLARAIRTLAGPWWLAAADGHHPEAAKTAAAAFKETFPGPKAAEALRFCHTQVAVGKKQHFPTSITIMLPSLLSRAFECKVGCTWKRLLPRYC